MRSFSTARGMALFGAVVLAAAACVPGGGAATGSPSQPPASAAPTTAASAPASGLPAGEVELWHIQTNGNGPALIEQAVARFAADNPQVTVVNTPVQNDAFKEKIKLAVGADNAPCIFPSWGGGPLYEYVTADKVIDLTSYMATDDYQDRFVDAAFSPVTFDGKIYGVPVENTSMALILYNKELFEQNGVTPPKTWEELQSVITTFKDKGIAPFALANKAKWPGSMWFMYLVDRLAGPGTFQSAATRTGGSFEDPTFIQAGELLQDLVEAGAFQEGFNGADWDAGQSRALLYSGKAAMELMGTWETSIIKGENPEFYPKIGVTPFPTVPNGTGDAANIVGTVGDNFYSISSTCENPEAAFALIQYLIDDESVKVRGEDGRIPPVKGFTSDDPLTQSIIDMIEAAPSVQLWYDQYLPPAVGQVHLDTNQALFGLTMTPEEAAKEFEAAAAQAAGN